MIFKHNYLNELPIDIYDKIFLLVNRSRFNTCIRDIDNHKIRFFYKFGKMLTDDLFYLKYSASELDKLGWFWKKHENPMKDVDSDLQLYDDDTVFAIYNLFEIHKRLSYKEYTRVSEEYINIRYYKFKYTDFKVFNRLELENINRFVRINFILQKYVIPNTNITIKKFIFTNNFIHIYINKGSYLDNTALDIAYNIAHSYDVIIDCLTFLNSRSLLFGNILTYLETFLYFESFDIKNKVITTIFSN